VFSKAKPHISQNNFDKGLEGWFELAKNPFRIFRVFAYLRYLLLLLGERVFRPR
jgi:N-acetylglucosaminyldiphosphoundecaprenol N-acetyl-beta-D-mannosaminyltransferase